MLVSWRIAAAVAVVLGAGAMGGCGSSEDPEDIAEPVAGSGDPLVIYFPKMYSAYIPGSERRFRIPAVVQGVKAEKWTAEPADAVDFEIDGVPNGVMMTTRKAGKVKIIARAGTRVGSAELNITEATEAQLEAGKARYDNAIQLMFTPGVIAGRMLPNNVSCKNCHGSGATFLAVEHTPQQTGGYSDDEIKKIFSMGMKPEGAKYGTFPGIERYYELFHKWAATEEEYQGLVVYMRSLEPKAQGELDFMGLVNMVRNRPPTTGAAGGAAMPPSADMGAAGAGMM